jgi:hypothetical protein
VDGRYWRWAGIRNTSFGCQAHRRPDHIAISVRRERLIEHGAKGQLGSSAQSLLPNWTATVFDINAGPQRPCAVGESDGRLEATPAKNSLPFPRIALGSGGSRERKAYSVDDVVPALHLIHHERRALVGSVSPYVAASKAVRRMEECHSVAVQLEIATLVPHGNPKRRCGRALWRFSALTRGISVLGGFSPNWCFPGNILAGSLPGACGGRMAISTRHEVRSCQAVGQATLGR